MEIDKILEDMAKLEKKVDRITTLLTKIAKTLHLLPVTEREEREIQLAQRKNLELAAKVNDDLNAMSQKGATVDDNSIMTLYNSVDSVFGDVVADDFLGGIVNE